ncbi:MAG: tRNA (N(6)-L-threonylcarbamoyladenosine(37)-C(2))-methylthiotransferase MtaB [Armatimonadota bacterium]
MKFLHRRPKAEVVTLGCKVNQYESARIADELWQIGFDVEHGDDRVDVCVINTCSVTHVAAAKSRQAIRRMRRRNPDMLVVVTGCGTSADQSAVRDMHEIDLVVPNDHKDDLALQIVQHIRDTRRLPLPPPRTDSARLCTGDRTRALLKVQDGCRNFCAYCIIPYTRGAPRSRPFSEVLDEARRVAESGRVEVVVTGICVGAYSDSGRSLPDLLLALANVPGIKRVRLSSVEPTDVTDRLISAIRDEPRVCRHVHLPLQSGDDELLKTMNRRYSVSDYLTLVDKLRSAEPEITLTTDAIVGFPGETNQQFRKTVDMIDRVGFAKVHVFPYSPREGTPAAVMPNQVPHNVKDARARELIRLSHQLERRFAERYVGRIVEVLVEGSSARPGWAEGLTDTYLRVAFPCDSALQGQLVKVRVLSAADGCAEGELVQ